MQDSYQRELSEKIQAIRNASARFADLAQLCSYHEIANTRLDIKDNQRLSKAMYELLQQGFREAQSQASERDQLLDRLGNRVIDENQATKGMIQFMALRMMAIEETISKFGESATSGMVQSLARQRKSFKK